MAATRVAFDDFADTVSSELRLHTPNLQIAGWEYQGSWIFKSAGPPDTSRVQPQSSTGFRYVRSTADISVIDMKSQPFTVEADIVKGAVDAAGIDGLIGFFQRGSGSAAPYNGEGVWVGWERQDASNVNVVARRVDSSGVIVETLIFATVAVVPNRRYTFAVAADGVTITATVSDLFTGLSPIALGNVVLGADIRDADHQRIGISSNATGSSATDIYKYDLLQDAALLNPWSECAPCAAGATVWAASDPCND
jgi:hypothetical protein